MRALNLEVLRAGIEATSQADIQSGRVGGIAIAVMQNGKTLYQECTMKN